MRYHVMPADDSSRYNWKVQANGRTTSRHRRQSKAVEAVRERGNPGDTVRVHAETGNIRYGFTIQ
jgi:hypothetical protein